jgi:hypothetical protein
MDMVVPRKGVATATLFNKYCSIKYLSYFFCRPNTRVSLRTVIIIISVIAFIFITLTIDHTVAAITIGYERHHIWNNDVTA